MFSARLWMFLVSISALVCPLLGCEDEQLPHRCGPRSEVEDRCLEDPVEARAGRGAVDLDGGRVPTTASDASPEDRADSGTSASVPKPNDDPAGPQCAGPTRYFAPSCPGVAWEGHPEYFAVQISPGCYRPCASARDAICGQGTRCGRAAFASTACNGRSCAPVCAETWLCLSSERFPREGGVDEDAGVSEDDAGWSW